MALGALIAVLVQSALGIVVNLYVTVPPNHPGANPSDYLARSGKSVAWAIAHGTASLVIHAVVGVVLILMALSVVARALLLGRRTVTVWSVLAALLVIGAAFGGASFLDFNNNLSSLLMALLAFAAAGAYGLLIFLLSQ
jgi:hypothetical protein